MSSAKGSASPHRQTIPLPASHLPNPLDSSVPSKPVDSVGNGQPSPAKSSKRQASVAKRISTHGWPSLQAALDNDIPPRLTADRLTRRSISLIHDSRISNGVGVGASINHRRSERSPSPSHSLSSTLSHSDASLRLTLNDSLLKKLIRWQFKTGKGIKEFIVFGMQFALLVRFMVARGDWSGKFQPPLYGDFEAQRNWLSITHNLPISQWYFHNLQYWGLDYPPLTAYHSWTLSWLAASFGVPEVNTLKPLNGTDEAWMNTQTQWIEEARVPVFMRTSVILSEMVVWIPAVIVWCWNKFHSVDVAAGTKARGSVERKILSSLFTIVFQPALILVDNGHFQYNSVMLGFTLWAMICFKSGHDLAGAIFFVFALCFKQMALYYAPVIFAYLLGKCFFVGGDEGVALFVQIGFTTISTFALILYPFFRPLDQLFQMARRVFPFARGLFEDKVANFWCAINVAIKLRELLNISTLLRLAFVVTILAVLPAMLALVWVSWQSGKHRKTTLNFSATTNPPPPPAFSILPRALFVCSMGFFLFSFQVHEKSILLPLMPLTLLMLEREAGHKMDWECAVLVNNVAVFSMWPLLKRDGLGLQYGVVTLFWNVLIGYNPLEITSFFMRYLSLGSYSVILLLHILEMLTTPPPHLPDLFVVLNLTLSAMIFGLSFLWGYQRLAQECWVAVTWLMEPPKTVISDRSSFRRHRNSRNDSIDSMDSISFVDSVRSRRQPSRAMSPLFSDDEYARAGKRGLSYMESERRGMISDGESTMARRRRKERETVPAIEDEIHIN